MKFSVKASAAAQVDNRNDYNGDFEGFLAWVDYHIGFAPDVELNRLDTGYMHGKLSFIFHTSDGEVKCSGYYSKSPVPTRKMTVSGGDTIRALFGKSREEVKALYEDADKGFDV